MMRVSEILDDIIISDLHRTKTTTGKALLLDRQNQFITDCHDSFTKISSIVSVVKSEKKSNVTGVFIQKLTPNKIQNFRRIPPTLNESPRTYVSIVIAIAQHNGGKSSLDGQTESPSQSLSLTVITHT
ncbi:hypothetical protein CEXT_722821 [Caerostris extrusa]|uniref:Uncharacterized protein n=1 Tax=Caerostris extrusa TaxID=172846 RepID=A0AAV4RDZ1_CAEEX|nr:hypothetical protein CEXT_722821 [Caerostris extrusa]